jgi:hypothetical protein
MIILTIATTALWLAIAAFLIWQFVRTRNPGYVILTVAVPLWWFVSLGTGRIMNNQIDRLMSGSGLSFPFNMLGDPTAGEFIMVTSRTVSILEGLIVLVGFIVLALHGASAKRSLDAQLTTPDHPPSGDAENVPIAR